MKLAKFQHLPFHPAAITLLSEDKVLVLIADGEQSGVHAFDYELSSVWHHPLTKPTTAMIAKGGTCWILTESGATALDSKGECIAQLDLGPKERLHPSAFAVLDDGLVIAWEHRRNSAMIPPIIERVSFQGDVIWSTGLATENVAYEGVVEMRADTGWKIQMMPARIPETWVSNLPVLPMSGAHLFVSFTEMPRSGIGMGYVLTLSEGAVCFTTKKGPIDEITPLDGGVFLVGYQGYGAFETLQYAANGDIENNWPSHGYCVPEHDGIRVIEMENILPSKSRLARLGAAGAIARGDRLDGYHTSRPYRNVDGALVFLRNGAANLARDLHITETIELPKQARSFYSRAVGDRRAVFCAQSNVSSPRKTLLMRIDI